MKRTILITVPALCILAILTFAVVRGQMSRELILKQNGLPLANPRADVLSAGGVVKTSTDLDGRLDLAAIPAEAEIAITLWDGTATVFNGDIFLPASGSRTIDFRGNQSITTTTRTYADFVVFKLTGRETEVWTKKGGTLP